MQNDRSWRAVWTDRIVEGAGGLLVGAAYVIVLAVLLGPMAHAVQHLA